MSSTPIDYAKYLGYQSLPAAVVFTIAYIPLALFFIFLYIRTRPRILITLVIYCISMCSMLSFSSPKTDEYFQLVSLHSSFAPHKLPPRVPEKTTGCRSPDKYSFLSDFLGYYLHRMSWCLTGHSTSCSYSFPTTEPFGRARNMELPETTRLSGHSGVQRLEKSRNTIFRTVGTVGAIMGIIVATSSDGNESLRKTSVIIFLVLAAVQALQTLIQIKNEQTRESLPYRMFQSTDSGISRFQNVLSHEPVVCWKAWLLHPRRYIAMPPYPTSFLSRDFQRCGQKP